MFADRNTTRFIRALVRTRRRGTILLLVLGALAMVLILTVVYAALGKGDRATGRAVVDHRDATEVVTAFGEHILGVVGDDLWDITPDFAEARLLGTGTDAMDPVYLTERIDAPVSDFSKRSVPSLDAAFAGASADELDLMRFFPSGRHSTASVWPMTGPLGSEYPVDPRIAADPWLSSSRPYDMGLGSKETSLIGGGNYFANPYYARALDWLQISNVAPDGRFVNLYEMRDDFGVPSLDLSRDPDTGEPRLTLFNSDGELQVAGGSGYVLGLAGVEAVDGTFIADPMNSEPDWNVPAHWTMYQRNMARTIAELSREGFNSSDPDSPTFWEYSYADADGDGIIDSRWFELVDASSGFEVPLLGDSRRRYFAAVKIADLSSRLNVNTASDQFAPASLESRPGEGPHEVSLFTLLSMDAHAQSSTFPDEGNIEYYADIFTGNGADAYTEMTKEETERQARKSMLRIRESIEDWAPVEFGTVPGGRGFGFEYDPSRAANRNGGEDESEFMRDFTPFTTAELRREAYSRFGSSLNGYAGGGNERTGPFGVSDLIELITFNGANDPNTFTALEQAMMADNPNRYSSDLDAPTRGLLRSDRSLMAEIGVEDTGNATTGALSTGELNRHARSQLDVRSLLTTISGSRPLRSVATDAGGQLRLTDTDRRLRADRLLLLSDRAYDAGLEAQNDRRNPAIAAGFGMYLNVLAPYLSEFEDSAAWPGSFGGVGGGGGASLADQARTLFYGHNGPEMALRMAAHMAVNFRDIADAPFIDDDNDGVPDAGLAEDMIDVTQPTQYAKRRDEPSRALLWLVQESERDLTNLTTMLDADGDMDIADDIAVLDADVLLGKTDPDQTVLARNATLPAGVPGAPTTDAMIVYGVEAQPFLSEVFYMNAYWDAPRGSPLLGETGEDSDFLGDNAATGEYSWNPAVTDPNLIQGDLINVDGFVRGVPNINGEINASNRDFLFQIVVFQLFNPFDVPVSLDDFYIEWAGEIFKTVDPLGVGNAPTLNPGETRLLYATNPGLDFSVNTERRRYLQIAGRISDKITEAVEVTGGPLTGFTGLTFPLSYFDSTGAATPVPGPVNTYLDLAQKTIESLVPDANRIPLQRYDAVDATLVNPFDDLLEGTPAAGASGNELNDTVLLWWDLGDRFVEGGGTAWRKDDMLADRLTDRSDTSILDQRLALDSVTFSGGTGGNPGGTVNGAFVGLDVDGPSSAGTAGPGNFGVFGTSRFPNVDTDSVQRSVALWSRIRRFDTSANEFGSGGRMANSLPSVSGVPATMPMMQPMGTNAQGDQAIIGVPAGAFPAAVFERGELNRLQAADDNRIGGDFRPESVHYETAFRGMRAGITTRVTYESSRNINDLFAYLINSDEFQSNRHATLVNGVLSASRYLFNGTDPVIGEDFQDVEDRMVLVDPNDPSPTYEPVPYSGDKLIQVASNSREFRSRITGVPQLRVGDLLNVLAVGPYRMPTREAGGTSNDYAMDGYPSDLADRVKAYDAQWTTLGEVLAVAEGYETILDNSNGFDDEFERLTMYEAPGSSNITLQRLDRGNLKLDEFVPFFDTDGDGVYAADIDRVRGLGIPLALTIFDTVQAGGELPDRAYGGISRPVTGLVNINTAPLSVLRSVPGLYTDVQMGVQSQRGVDVNSPFWPRRLARLASDASFDVAYPNAFVQGTTSLADLSGMAFEARNDVASSIQAYREVGAGTTRVTSGLPGGLGGLGAADAFDMRPRSAFNETGTMRDARRGFELDRWETARITGLRTAPGIASIGELMAVRPGDDVDEQDPTTSKLFMHGMDWIGRDRRTISQIFVDATTGNVVDPAAPFDGTLTSENRLVTLDPVLLGDPLRFDEALAAGDYQLPVTDQIPDDYDEQLVQINMLLNSVSTSSDYYAAWYVVHGFEDDDVEDLEVNEPMRPSFRARYLMILDRSNVVRRGDKPRVLAFMEVPYDEDVRNAVFDPSLGGAQ